MPLFEFKCQNCGQIFEELVFSSRVSEDEITCPHCGLAQAEKLISAPAIAGTSEKTISTSPSCAGSGFS